MLVNYLNKNIPTVLIIALMGFIISKRANLYILL